MEQYKQQLTDIRNELYEKMPTGRITAWDLTTYCKELFKRFDEYIDAIPAPQDVPVGDFSQLLKEYKQQKEYVEKLGGKDRDWTMDKLPVGKQETLHFLQGYKEMIRDLDVLLYGYEEGLKGLEKKLKRVQEAQAGVWKSMEQEEPKYGML